MDLIFVLPFNKLIPVCALVGLLLLACGGGGNGSPTATPRPRATAADQAATTATTTPSPPRSGASPAPEVLDRTGDCEAIRGTEYETEQERRWFLSNCLPGQVATTPAPATPQASPAGPTPTPTPQPICRAQASLSDSNPPLGSQVTVSASLSCPGLDPGGMKMVATFRYRSRTQTCDAISDSAGKASCSVVVEGGTVGVAARVDACFSFQTRIYCGSAAFTPR